MRSMVKVYLLEYECVADVAPAGGGVVPGGR